MPSHIISDLPPSKLRGIQRIFYEIVEKIRQRAKRHHRSLQGELMAILEEATGPGRLSVDEAESRLRDLRFETGDDSVAWLRELRDAR